MPRKLFAAFISHHSLDKPWATRLKEALEARGLRIWLDHEEIRPGDLFVNALEKGLQESRAVLLVVSPEALSSKWVEEEYARALSLSHDHPHSLRLIPILLRGADPPGFLSTRHCVDFRDPAAFDQSLDRLVWGLTGKKQSAKGRRPRNAAHRTSGVFDVPVFADQVLRPLLLTRLEELATSFPVIAVEGLSGSGKTYVVASFLKRYAPGKEAIYWYDTHEHATLNDLLASIETRLPLPFPAAVAKCKELIHALRQQNGLLIIDDFHQVDQASFATLIDTASKYGDHACLILISRMYVDLVQQLPRIGHLEVRGFPADEMRQFLNGRGLPDMEPSVLSDLIRTTDGLPLAASLFATLVLDFGRQPSDLLRDSMTSTVRCRTWFDEVLLRVGEAESRLLHVLSVCEGPFNMAVVRKLATHEGIAGPEQTFEGLQRRYLVQRYSTHRWSVHQLIAMFCAKALDPEHRRAVNLQLARHYLSGYSITRPRVLNEDEFLWKSRACRQFQLAREFGEADPLLRDLSRTVNFRGHYELFLQLSAIQIAEHAARSGWVDYHHAHFCLITGKLNESIRTIEPLVYKAREDDATLRLSSARVYAEATAAIGKPERALHILREITGLPNLRRPGRTALSQLRATEVGLLTRLGRYPEAAALCQDLLSDAAEDADVVGRAVALTLDGVNMAATRELARASRTLAAAVQLFRRSNFRRGLAWSLSHLGLSQLEASLPSAHDSLRESLRIYSEIGECSMDYLGVLKTARPRVQDAGLVSLIDTEVGRVTAAVDDLSQAFVDSSAP